MRPLPFVPRARPTTRSRAIPSERYRLAKSLFLSALALPPAEREGWLAGQCGDDEALRREVGGLLVHHVELEGGAPLLGDGEAGQALPAALGDYRVLGVLGHGGMGVVYRAQRGEQAPVALKVLRSGLLSPSLLARFGRESEALARLDHPGIARLHETGVFETPHGPRPYFAMELVEGVNLRVWAGRTSPLEERLELLARVCDAVEHAHGHGVVHRDLKPENVLVRPDGSPCVLDFGVARFTESGHAATLLTSAGVLVGTIRYMSPEQADASPREVDARSDVYTLGVIAQELLSGAMPYDVPSDSLHRALVAVITARPRPMPQVPGPRGRALEAVLGKALAKAAGDRYPGAAELAADLRRVAAGHRPHARPPRRPLSPARALLVAGLVVVALLVAVRTPPGQRLLDPLLPRPGAGDPGTRRAITLLTEASTRMQALPREAPRIRAGLALCDSARRVLAASGEKAPPRLARMAWVLSMNARLWLGDFEVSPGEYDACIEAGQQALQTPDAPAATGASPAASRSLTARLQGPLMRDPEGLMALAASRLALYREPWTQQHRALAWNEAALARLEEREREPGAARPPEGARRALHGERGIMLARAGALADSAPQVRAGMRWLETPPDPPADDEAARQALAALLRVGIARTELGRIEGEPAVLDTAIADLSRALGLASAVTQVLLESNVRLWLAQAHRVRANLQTDPAAARRDLEEALEPLERRLSAPPGTLSPRYVALLRLRREEVRLDLAERTVSPAFAESARVTLALVRPLFTSGLHPVVRSDVEIADGRANAILWAASGDPARREEALRHFRAAGRLVAANEDPHRARRVRAGTAALRAGRWTPGSGAF